jgi:hypothetical protein
MMLKFFPSSSINNSTLMLYPYRAGQEKVKGLLTCCGRSSEKVEAFIGSIGKF